MGSVPPQGMTEVDYEAIEAAVTETVRGRWFLSEFARRNRLSETRQVLDAIGRVEAAVAGQSALPSADPSIRLLIQRVKDIAGQLDALAGDMRDNGVPERYWSATEMQARAVAGMMRNAPPVKSALPDKAGPAIPPALPRMPRADLPPALAPRADPPAPAAPPVERAGTRAAQDDPRLAILSGLDSLPLAKKLALFS